MIYVYIICAAVGGTLIVVQFVMTLMGLGDHDMAGDAGDADVSGHDAGHAEGHELEPHGHEATDLLFGVITLRTVTAGLAFFGLTGWILEQWQLGWNTAWVVLASIGVGMAALVIVAQIMRWLSKLNADGTVRIHRAVGAKGTAYLPIPGAKGGSGKVHVTVQGQMKEYKAITAHSEIETGANIVVVKVVGSDTVEVVPAEALESAAT